MLLRSDESTLARCARFFFRPFVVTKCSQEFIVFRGQLTAANVYQLRNTLSTAGNSMTSSERPSPEPLLKKEASPAVLEGREFWKCSGAFKRLELLGLGDPSRTLEDNSRKSSESVFRVFPEFLRNFFRKVPAVLGVWPRKEGRKKGKKEGRTEGRKAARLPQCAYLVFAHCFSHMSYFICKNGPWKNCIFAFSWIHFLSGDAGCAAEKLQKLFGSSFSH